MVSVRPSPGSAACGQRDGGGARSGSHGKVDKRQKVKPVDWNELAPSSFETEKRFIVATEENSTLECAAAAHLELDN